MPPQIPPLHESSTSSNSASFDNLSISSISKRIALMSTSREGEDEDNYCRADDHLYTDSKPPIGMSDALLAVNISEAITSGNIELLNKFLSRLKTTMSAFTSPFGNLLHISASLASLETFKKILDLSKLSINSHSSNDGSTPLHVAVRLGRYEIVEYLLSKEDIDDTIRDLEDSRTIYKDKIQKLLHKAVQQSDLERFKFLLSNPRTKCLIDINATDSSGNSILHHSVKTDSTEMLKECLDCGADPFMKNKKGKIPLQLTKKNSMRKLLKEAPMIRSKEDPLKEGYKSKFEGYLYKYTNFAGGYRRRWFVLERGVLSYYNNPTEYPISCRGSVNLEYVNILPNNHNLLKFELIGTRNENVKFYLKAETEDEAKKWIISLMQSQNELSSTNQVFEPSTLINIMQPSTGGLNLNTSNTNSPYNLNTVEDSIEMVFSELKYQEKQIWCLFHDELSDEANSNNNNTNNNNNSKKSILASIERVHDFIVKFELLLAQKNRRLDAQRKEKDLLEDAVRSLALENNKWQSWARQQLLKLDSSQSEKGGGVDVLRSLEEHCNNERDHLELEKQPNSNMANSESMCSEEVSSIEEQFNQEQDDQDNDDDEDLFFDVFESVEVLNRFESVDSSAIMACTALVSDSTITDSSDDSDFDSFGYPLERRMKIPVDSSKMPTISLWNILKNAIRHDLSRMPIPINFSEPLSMLQRMSEDLEYFELLRMAASKKYKNDPAMRLIYIAAFAITSYSGTDGRVSKPFNPLLGETYELVTPSFKYLAEQVSHHPPIGASHCVAEGEFEYWNEVHVTSKFRGKYLELKPEGLSHVIINSTEEDAPCHYSWNRVSTAVNNIIVGKLYLEHYGKMKVKSHGRDGLTAEIDFLPTGWRRGTTNRIEGKILDEAGNSLYLIKGTWNQSIEVIRVVDSTVFPIWEKKPLPPGSELMYNFSSFAMTLNELTPKMAKTICPTDSRFRPDQRAMEEGSFEAASLLKVRLEEKQRMARKLMDSQADFAYEPKWFRKCIERDTGLPHWKYIKGYWERREEITSNNSEGWSDIPNIYL